MKTCARCGKTWYPRTKNPKRCPNHACATYYWKKTKTGYRHRRKTS